MSVYAKPQQVGYDYSTATTRPDQASGYTSFVAPNYAAPYMTPHAQVPSGLPNSPELSMGYGAHDTSYTHTNSTYPSFIAAGPRHYPEVTSYTPSQGPAGRKLLVYLASAEELVVSPALYFFLTFGNKRCNAMLSKLGNLDQQPNYLLSADVPAFDATGCSSTQVPLFFDVSDGASQGMPVEFGQYSYTDATAYTMSSPPDDSSRKRKLSIDVGVQSPSKRTLTHQLRQGESSPRSSNTLSPYAQTQQAPNYAYTHTPTRSHYQPVSQASQATPRYGLSPHATASHLGMNTQQQAAPSYGSYGTYSGAPTSAAMITQTSIGSATANDSNPALVRTSALQDSVTSPLAMSASPFNPYAMYPSNTKAVLKLDSELNTMAEQWTTEEVQTQRRLVRFRRSQSGSTINASFEPVTPEDHARSPGNIYVNCIWWKEKQACFITSVDTIQLLESLVAVRFTVEEKNRIRRNLEGFRPMTVSKTRPECEEFFKTIMGFPSPKPRNIEKDVKVFPWRILGHALKKIIGKYSASYSSTAAAIPSSHAASASSGSNGHERPTVSPPSASTSSANMQYPASMPPNNMSPHGGSMVGPAGSQGPPDMRVTMPQSNVSGWHQPSSHYTTDISHGRPSWDFSYMADTPSAGMSGYGSGQRIPSISASLGLGSFGNYYVQPSEYKDYNQRTTQA